MTDPEKPKTRIPSGNIERNLYLLVVCAILPALLIILQTGLRQKSLSLVMAHQQLENLNTAMTRLQTQQIRQAQRLLHDLASRDEIKNLDGPRCQVLFAKLLGDYPDLAAMGLASPDGKLAASQGLNLGGTLAGQAFFTQTLAGQRLTLGHYLSPGPNQISAICASLPVFGPNQALAGVVFVLENPGLFEEALKGAILPEALHFTVADSHGLIIANDPASRGQKPLGSPLVPANWQIISSSGQDSGQFTSARHDGLTAFFHYRKLRLAPDQAPYLYLLASRPLPAVLSLADKAMWLNLSLLALAGFMALFIARMLGRAMLLTRVRAMAQSEARLRAVFEGNLEAMLLILPDGSILEANQAAQDLFGLTQEQLRQVGRQGLVDLDDPRLGGYIAQGQLQDKVHGLLRHRRGNGELFEGEFSASYFTVEGQTLASVSLRDVSEREQAKEALRQSEEKYRSVVENIQDGYYRANSQGQLTLASPSAAAMLGYARAESCLGRDIGAFWKNPSQRLDFLEQLSATGILRNYETQLRKTDGSIIWVSVSSFLIRDAAQNPIGVEGVFRDITAHKQAEEALRQSQHYLQTILDNIPWLISYWDRDLRIRFGNQAHKDWFGVDAARLTGMHVSELLGEEGFAQTWPYIEKVLAGEPQIFERTRPIPGSQDVRHIQVQYFPDLSQGQVQGFMALVADITAMKREQAELERAKKAAETANKAKSEFLANMSHEIRTPLNGVLGMLQILESEELSPSQRECLNMAINAAKRLTQLLSDILDISRIEAGRLVLQEGVFSLVQQRQAVMDLFSPPARDKGLDFTFDLDPRLPSRLLGDQTRLRQVLFNLVGNAVKFTEKGHIRVEVWNLPQPTPQTARALITVSDTGVGISDSQVRRIFEPFVQGDGSYSRAFQGAGLGLSIVRELVGLLGGTLCLENHPEDGCAFYVSLPFKLAAPAPAPELTPDQARLKASGKRLRILLVEDDETSLEVASRALSLLGHETVGLTNGLEVLPKLAHGAFDLMLLDIQLPGMDGLALTRAIRQSAHLGPKANIPIIAMTAYAMSGDQEKFLEAGMDGYIAKPFTFQELSQAIASVLP